MFTIETYKQLKLYFTFSNILSNLPLRYDHKSRGFSEISLLAKIWYFTLLLWVLVRGLYHVSWALSNFVYGFPSVTDTTVEITYGISTIIELTLNFRVYLHRAEFLSHLNHLLLTNERLSAQFLSEQARTGQRHWKTREKFSDGCAFYMRLLTPSGINTGVTFGILFLLQSDKRLYYYALIPGAKPLWLTVLYFLWECYTISWQIGVVFFIWYTSILYSNSCCFWIDQITNSSVTTQWTKYPLHRTRASLKIYKWMQIITTEHNQSIGGFVMAVVHAFAVLLQVVSVFVIVKFHDKLPITFLVAFAGCAVMCLGYEIFSVPVYGKVYEKSSQFLKAYDERSLGKEWRMMKRALWVLGVNVGGRYVLKPQTTLTFVSLGITMTANLLVSTN